MNPAQRNQLLELDRALLSLCDERARMLRDFGVEAPADPRGDPALDDLLRRHDGPIPADGVRSFFAAVDAACRAELRP